MAFYSTTLGKNVPSLRFTITGGTGGGSSYAVNSASGTLSALDGASVISGSGTVSRLEGGGPRRHLRLRNGGPHRRQLRRAGLRLPGRHHHHRHRKRP